MGQRKPIPHQIQSRLLIANRHACCVCQKIRVQIHHIDGNPNNNEITNLAALCVDHHDMASMQIGLTKKLQPYQIKEYKRSWEAKCEADIMALARDRVSYYATLYKNPPRIRQAFSKLNQDQREMALRQLATLFKEEAESKANDEGYQWQMLPTFKGERTTYCLDSAWKGELWPSWLPRVTGHAEDPDLPIDMAPPNGMEAYHTFDLYCQILTQFLTVISPPIPFEEICKFTKDDDFNAFDGDLVSFRQRITGKNVVSPRLSEETPLGRLQLKLTRGKFLYRATMQIKNMYVFSDTSAENMRNCKACGIGIFGGATKSDTNQKEIEITIIPLLIGFGGKGFFFYDKK